MHGLSDNARAAIDRIVKAFDTPETLIDTVARASLIPATSPCAKWGPINRFLVALHGTSDARGFRQWQEAGRKVKKGAKAFHILVPRFKKAQDEEQDDEHHVLIGFIAAPVFTVEATEGDPLSEPAPTTRPTLWSVADALGVPVRNAEAVSERIAGVYIADRSSGTGSITLYTHDVQVFYHELSHALHDRIGKLRPTREKGDKRDNETVAELSAAVLMRIVEGDEMGRQAIQYAKSYGATKTRLLVLLPEIIEVVETALSLASNTGETSTTQEPLTNANEGR